MESIFKDAEQVHEGSNVKTFRELQGIKQVTLAEECGWSQQLMSKLENSATIDDKRLKTIAEKLGVTSEIIRNFKKEKAIYFIQSNNTLQDEASQQYQPIFNISSNDDFTELIKKFIHDEQQKSQSMTELWKAVLSIVEEVKEMKKKD